MALVTDEPIASLEFARLVQHLAREARAIGLTVPGFRSVAAQEAPLQVLRDGGVVSIRGRMPKRQAWNAIVDGLLIVNDADPSQIEALQDCKPEWVP